jgi:hypothetical protein
MSQPATPAPRSTARRKWPGWVRYTGWTLLGILATSGFVALITYWFGGVHGVELNPYSFARRSYSFYEVPIIRLQVRGIRREPVTCTAVDFLEQQKYVADSKKAPDVWHIVVGTRGASPPTIGNAEILADYLDAINAETMHQWVAWSEKNPKLAPALWKAVSRLAQEEQYVYLPDLFDLATSANDPAQFQAALNKAVATRLFELGLQLQAEDDHAQAKKYLAEAAQLDQSNPLIKRALEKSAAQAPK